MKISKYALVAALGFFGLLAPSALWADDIVYTVNGTFGGGTTTLLGTITIDSTTGQTISGTVTTTGGMALGPLALRASNQTLVPGDWNDKFNNAGLPTVDFAYNWPPSSLSSIPLISPTSVDQLGLCGPNACGIFFLTSPTTVGIVAFDGGGLTQEVAPVPEPASLLLLGTGLAGLAGFSRRKRSKMKASS